ncbi:MAG: cytochrome P460 family protein [Gemmatimonadota bacterium]
MRKSHTKLGLLWGFTLAGVSACAPADDGEQSGQSSTETPAQTVAAVSEPDTTGAAMWAHLRESDYQESWALWPETEAFYQGIDPHGALLTTYVNTVAESALLAGQTMLPEGSVVVKENFMPDEQLAAVTVMYKRTGYNPEHNDWFFVKYLPDGSLDQTPGGMAMEGRVPGCQACHMAKRDVDYLYTPRPTEQ